MKRVVYGIAALSLSYATGQMSAVAADSPDGALTMIGSPTTGGVPPGMPMPFGFPGSGRGTFGMAGGPGFNAGLMVSGHPTSLPILTPIDALIRSHLKISGDRGLMVSHVAPRSPAWAAGLRDQDILLTLGDSPLASPEDLIKKLKESGEKSLSLTLLRAGEKKTIQVKPLMEVGIGPIPSEKLVYALGLTASSIEPLLRMQLRLPEGQGLSVRHVEDGGPAAKAGIALGDLLLTLNGKNVDSEQSLYTLVQAEGDQPIELVIIHKGDRKSISVSPTSTKAITLNLIGVAVDESIRHGFPSSARTIKPNGFQDKSTVTFTPLTGTVVPFMGRPGDMMPGMPPVNFKMGGLSGPGESLKSSESIAKKLDEMSAQISSLRKAVDELSRANKN